MAVPLNATLPPTVASVILKQGLGAFAGGPIRTGTFPIAGDELNYATCGVCVVLDPWLSGSIYMATGGTVTLTSLSPNLAVTLSTITFEHVDVDPLTSVSTPTADGCRSVITSMSVDAVVGIRP